MSAATKVTPPKSPAQRMRESRDRQKHGTKVVPVEVTREMKGALLEQGLLSQDQADDREAISTAIEKAVMATNWTRQEQVGG